MRVWVGILSPLIGLSLSGLLCAAAESVRGFARACVCMSVFAFGVSTLGVKLQCARRVCMCVFARSVAERLLLG